MINEREIDAVFLDINMPGLSGLELAAVLANFSRPPALVFVTAHEDKAIAAFEVGAVDYLLQPIREERLDAALRRVRTGRGAETAQPAESAGDDVIGGTSAGSQLVRCDTIGWVEADGDYARLHTSSGSHLVRIPLSTLEDRWRSRGFQACAPVLSGRAQHGDRAAHIECDDHGSTERERLLPGRTPGQPSAGPRTPRPADPRPHAQLPPRRRR